MREELGEEEKQQESAEEDNRQKPNEPRDPEDRTSAQPEGGAEEAENPRQNLPPWLVNLPPQIRDAFAREDFDAVPPRYRTFVQGYLMWLLEEERKQSTGR